MPNMKIGAMSAKAIDRARQTHEQQLLVQSREAGYQEARPVLQPPSSFIGATRSENIPNGHSQGLEQVMGGLSIGEQQQNNESDSWKTVPMKKNSGKLFDSHFLLLAIILYMYFMY